MEQDRARGQRRLPELPAAVLALVCDHLSFTELVNLQLSSRAFRDLVRDNPQLWQLCVERTHHLPYCPYGPGAPAPLRALVPEISTLSTRGPCYPRTILAHLQIRANPGARLRRLAGLPHLPVLNLPVQVYGPCTLLLSAKAALTAQTSVCLDPACVATVWTRMGVQAPSSWRPLLGP